MTDTENTTETSVRTVVWPTLHYADARAAIRWLVDVLGFTERAVYGDGDRVDHAELVRPGGGGVMLGSVREDRVVSEVPIGQGAVYVVVDSEDELRRLYDAALAAEAPMTEKLDVKDYGGAGFTCRDPEGVHWSLGTYTGE